MRKFAMVGALIVSACGSDPSATGSSSVEPAATCDSIRDAVVETSSDKDVKILKIYDPETISDADNLLSCKGSAMISTGDERQTVYYKLEKDEEGDSFVGYSPEPYPTKK